MKPNLLLCFSLLLVNFVSCIRIFFFLFLDHKCVCVGSVAQLCLTLCGPMNCSPPGSSVLEFFRQEYCVGCHFLLQGIFLTQRLNPCLLCLFHWQADSLPLTCQGSPDHKCISYHFFKKFKITALHIQIFNLLSVNLLMVKTNKYFCCYYYYCYNFATLRVPASFIEKFIFSPLISKALV